MGLRRRAPFLIQFVGKICHKCSSQNLTLFLGALVAGIEEMAFAPPPALGGIFELIPIHE